MAVRDYSEKGRVLPDSHPFKGGAIVFQVKPPKNYKKPSTDTKKQGPNNQEGIEESEDNTGK